MAVAHRRGSMDHGTLSLLSASALFGLTSSLHCAGMCGPLAACASGTVGAPRPARLGDGGEGALGASMRYQLARWAGYGLVGAATGAVGAGVSGALGSTMGAYLPWAMALLLLVQALGVSTRVKRVPLIGGLLEKVARLSSGWSTGGRALALGAVTPLLPCGLLLGMYGLAAASGSALSGALTMLAFAAGTTPLLLTAQLGWGALSRGKLARYAAPAQRLVLLAAAVTLALRGWSMAQGASCHLGP